MQALEKRNRQYRVDQGGAGVAWLLWQGGVVNNVVGRGTSSGVGLVVYQREEGEEIVNIKQT